MPAAVSPREANALFEALAPDPPTAAEQADVRNQFSALQWLGDYNVPCQLERLFEVDGRAIGPEHFENPEHSERIVGSHFSRFCQTLATLRNGERSSALLKKLTGQFVDRPFLKVEGVQERIPGDGFRVGQFIIRSMKDGIDVIEQPEDECSYMQPTLLRFDRSGTEKLFVAPNSQQRYHAEKNAGRLTVSCQTILSLKSGDPAYFGQLHEDLQGYLDSLHEAVELAGIDAATLTDPRTQKLRFTFLREEVDPVMAEAYPQGRIPKDFTTQMAGRLLLIWQSVRELRSYDPISGTTTNTGIRYTGLRVGAYFRALLTQSPKSET